MAYYAFRSGLGDAETEADCPEPVPSSERDALRNHIKEWTNPHERKHFVENHPDIGLVYDDIVNRLRGLENRPKLLRCDKDARNRASTWLAQLDELGRKVRPTYPGAGSTSVAQTFTFTVFRGPTYTIRSSAEQLGRSPAPPSAPPGSVVVGGEVYPSSRAAAAAASPTTSANGTTPLPAGGAWVPPPGAGGADFLAGELIPGIPNQYLLYGALGLVAFRMMKGR